MVTATRPTELESLPAHDAYHVSVAEYRKFRDEGFLVVRGLVSPEEIDELKSHVEDLMNGRLPEQNRHTEDAGHGVNSVTYELAAPPDHLSPEEKAEFFLRIHMLHRKLEMHERFLLHPRVLDVLQALIGPDLLALQSMLFIKGPGKPGQGWHQDSYYIPTHPDTLCGAWIAIDECDEQNGAVWFATGSQNEPVYPPPGGHPEVTGELGDLNTVAHVSNPDDSVNELAPIANKYHHLLAAAKPGDVVFFAGHVLHRSKQNWTTDRFRRSFVGHYCNARSFTQWNDGEREDADPVTGGTNHHHILARGDTHLPFSTPRFGTPCAALLPKEQRVLASQMAEMMMGDMDTGMMGAMEANPDMEDDD